ncbi:MAG: hypothetical protein HOJ57_43180 [Lentisphaerae bacterium]|jgi:hypothetical protein|nr:hypothetical protein [Lentisphaerota bacterium]MBT5612818.1 hypothetical protein [Lentisphaerota bacterium]MBT7056009.1 hypothetical protein [Lentisphaerota bacterium]
MYYVKVLGKLRGPFSPARALALLEEGRWDWTVPMSEDKISWQPANEYPELVPQSADRVLSADERLCPECGGVVKAKAILCKHCRRGISAA